MIQVRIVISPKHPDGAVWAALPEGWSQLAGSIDDLGLLIDPGITRMDAVITVSDNLSDKLLKAGATPVVLPESGCCTGE